MVGEIIIALSVLDVRIMGAGGTPPLNRGGIGVDQRDSDREARLHVLSSLSMPRGIGNMYANMGE